MRREKYELGKGVRGARVATIFQMHGGTCRSVFLKADDSQV
jgi:hypothetical protein